MKRIINWIKNNLWYTSLILVLFFSTSVKVIQVTDYNFPFTMDQGRDMVDIRHMVVTYTPRLVGPTTSINGVLLGPFWYYFNLVPFLIGNGDPSYLVYWQILWYQVAVLVLWKVMKQKSLAFASIASILLLLTPTGFNTSRYFWNANSMTFFTIFYFVAFFLSIQSRSMKNLLLLGLLSGLAMQVEAAFGIVFFPFAFLYFLATSLRFWHPSHSSLSPLKYLSSLTAGFFITLIPQILFEIRHGFIMTKLLISEFTGTGEMLGEKITFVSRLTERWEYLVGLMRHSSHIPENTVFFLFALALVAFIYSNIKKTAKNNFSEFWTLPILFVVFSGIFYILFPQKLKIWYTLGLSIPLALFMAGFIHYLAINKIKILKIMAALILGLTVFHSIQAQTLYIQEFSSQPSNDRSNLKNELVAVDWVYQNAAGKGFKVFSYLPSVYDYPYNHLFWWYGRQKYGYHPTETAYLPNQPEYIRDVDKLWTSKRDLDSQELTFLIIESDSEMPVRVQEWTGNFSKLCLIKEHTTPWLTQIKMMGKCQ